MERILFTSIPKCGTNLLMRYFPLVGLRHAGPFGDIQWQDSFLDCVRTFQPGEYVAWHYHWSEELRRIALKRGIRVIFLYRDPRAQMVSNMHYILHSPVHRLHTFFTEQLKTTAQRLMCLIFGIEGSKDVLFRPLGIPEESWPLPHKPYEMGIGQMYDAFEGWLHEPACFSVRFEDLVGAKGEGDDAKQLATVEALIRFTGAGVDHHGEAPQACAVAKALFHPEVGTFRKGVINSWKEEFDEQTYNAFLETFGDRFRIWGYDREMR